MKYFALEGKISARTLRIDNNGTPLRIELKKLSPKVQKFLGCRRFRQFFLLYILHSLQFGENPVPATGETGDYLRWLLLNIGKLVPPLIPVTNFDVIEENNVASATVFGTAIKVKKENGIFFTLEFKNGTDMFPFIPEGDLLVDTMIPYLLN